jgi:hypothetical protein
LEVGYFAAYEWNSRLVPEIPPEKINEGFQLRMVGYLAKRSPPIVQHPACCHNQCRKRSLGNVHAARAALLFFFLEDAGGNKRGTVIRAKLG